MRRGAVTGLVALALVGVLPAASPGQASFPTRLQVVGDEFTLTLSRQWVPNKKVRIEFVNFGEDPHDLRLRRIGGTHTFVIPETLSGERRTRTFRLPRGRYRVWCAVDGHQAWGMRATLRVGRPS